MSDIQEFPTRPKTKDFTIKMPMPESFDYANAAQVLTSTWDIRLLFVDVTPPRGTTDPEVLNCKGIVMPPDRAAALAVLLVKQIISFEDATQKINLEPWRQLVNVLDNKL